MTGISRRPKDPSTDLKILIFPPSTPLVLIWIYNWYKNIALKVLLKKKPDFTLKANTLFLFSIFTMMSTHWYNSFLLHATRCIMQISKVQGYCMINWGQCILCSLQLLFQLCPCVCWQVRSCHLFYYLSDIGVQPPHHLLQVFASELDFHSAFRLQNSTPRSENQDCMPYKEWLWFFSITSVILWWITTYHQISSIFTFNLV